MIYSKLLKSAILPVADKLMNTKISKYYKLINKMSSFDKIGIEEWQNENLQKLITHVYNNTKYYKNLFDNHGIDPQSIRKKSDLSMIPTINKSIIRNNYEDLIPNNIDDIPFTKSATGGSTGEPLKFYLDKKSWSFMNAFTIYKWEKSSEYNYGDKYLALGSTSLYVDKDLPLKHKIYYGLKNKVGKSGINMSDETCFEYVDFIKSNKIKFIYGYASSIYLLSKYIIKKNINLDIQACFPTSEILTKTFRSTIENALQCPIIDSYGAKDGGISAISFKNGFYEVSYNSLIRLEEAANTNRARALLVTDVFNYSMPLLNYKIGDEIIIEAGKNEEYQYNGQVINKIMGRTSDMIELANGNVLTGPGFTILFKDLPVDYYCIEKVNSDKIICHIGKQVGYGEDEERIIKETLYKQIGKGIELHFNYTDKVFVSKNGKRKYFINPTKGS